MAEITHRDGGLLAEFKDVTALVRACKKVRDAGYEDWDAYSPFPIHGIDPAMGIRPTRIPWAIFMAGITGTTTAFVMQWWMNAVDYPWLISGKPFWSIPANVPIGFELTVLFSALTAFLLTLAVNGLPSLYTPLFNSERFKRATDDGFFLSIAAADKQYDALATRKLLEGTNPLAVEHIEDDSHVSAGIPRNLKLVAAVLVTLTFVPLGVIAKARTGTGDSPRVHLIPHMDFQPKYKAQSKNTLFADERAMRMPVEGTVAHGELSIDEHYHRGVANGGWARALPPQVELNAATLDRGHERYDIYCAPCHGTAGYGDGMIHRRAEKIGAPKWIQPTSLHDAYVRGQAPGQLYNTITHGIRNMPPYGHAIPEADRWAIVAYIKALQLSQYASVNDVPEKARLELR
jgi:mono/diheme cytochrome c family protein